MTFAASCRGLFVFSALRVGDGDRDDHRRDTGP
jgi:hypothetical protein